MDVTVSWDLLIIIFFAVVLSYSFIIGKDQSMKVIVATYVAIIATQGIGNVLFRLTGETPLGLEGYGITLTTLSMTKVFLFAVFLIIFCIKSGMEMGGREHGSVMGIIYTGAFGFATAGLIVSTLLAYISGNPVVGTNAQLSSEMLAFIGSSTLMQLIALNQDIWFTLPALLIIAAGFLGDE